MKVLGYLIIGILGLVGGYFLAQKLTFGKLKDIFNNVKDKVNGHTSETVETVK